MSLTVLAGNDEAARFYRRFGMASTQHRMLGPIATKSSAR